MRYLIYFLVLLSDVLILGALVLVWMNMNLWLAILMTAMAFKAWHDSGGFMAWRPRWIREFFINAKELGL